MKILAVTPIGAGVRYHRVERPHHRLNALGYADVDMHFGMLEDLEKAKQYDILVFHTQFLPHDRMPMGIASLRKSGVKVVMDVDDYWKIPKNHHNYIRYKETQHARKVLEYMSMCDMVVFSTKVLSDFAGSVPRRKCVVPNSIDFTDPQFSPLPDHPRKPKGRVAYGVITGSSHRDDMELLRGLTNGIVAEFGDGVATVLCGYNLEGPDRMVHYVSKEMADDLKAHGMLDRRMVSAIDRAHGDTASVKGMPAELVRKHGKLKKQVFERPMDPKNTVWYHYERILTNNFSTIENPNYYDYLHSFKKSEYPWKNVPHVRQFTKPANEYAKFYSLLDISLVPLLESEFNSCKSNLKLLEGGAHKKAVVCSDVESYSDAEHGLHCFKVRQRRKRDWGKYLRKLVKDESLRAEMGEALHAWVRENYDMDDISAKRAEAYKSLLDD